MISKKRAIEGLTAYLESEIISKIKGVPKWLSGAFTRDIVKNYVDEGRAFLEMVNCLSEDGMIDANRFTDRLLESAKKYGSVTQSVKFIGDISFSENDILTLKRYLGI